MTNNEPPTYRSVMIHASAVEYQGKALVFLGPSGTGKSTISQLLARTLEGARVLADDIAYLAWQNGGWQVVGDTSPNFQQEVFASPPVHISQCVPLECVFRLYQASLPRVEPMRDLTIGVCLMNALLEVSLYLRANIEEKKLYFSSLSDIARVTPGYIFYFERSVQTIEILTRDIIILQYSNVLML